MGDKANSSQILVAKHFTFQRQPAAGRWAQQSRAAAGAGGAAGAWSRRQETHGAHSGCCCLTSPGQVPHHPCGSSVAPEAVGCPCMQPRDQGLSSLGCVGCFPSPICSLLLPSGSFPAWTLSSSHLCVSPRLCSSGECGALAAAAISQPPVLQNRLCAPAGTVPVAALHKGQVLVVPRCCFLPHSWEAHGECPEGLRHLLFSVLLHVTSS